MAPRVLEDLVEKALRDLRSSNEVSSCIFLESGNCGGSNFLKISEQKLGLCFKQGLCFLSLKYILKEDTGLYKGTESCIHSLIHSFVHSCVGLLN